VSYGNANFEQQSFHLYINYTLYLAYLSSNKSHNTAAFLYSVSALIELKCCFLHLSNYCSPTSATQNIVTVFKMTG